MSKKFKDTKFGAFFSKVKEAVVDSGGDLLNIAGSVATGNYVGALSQMGSMLNKKAEKDEEAKRLLAEFTALQMEFEREMYELEIKDRDSARKREIEVLKAGGSDWLMNLTGVVGLLTFALLVVSVLFFDLNDSPILHQMIGMVEGVALTIFAYYYGTSKSSKDKDSKIN